MLTLPLTGNAAWVSADMRQGKISRGAWWSWELKQPCCSRLWVPQQEQTTMASSCPARSRADQLSWQTHSSASSRTTIHSVLLVLLYYSLKSSSRAGITPHSHNKIPCSIIIIATYGYLSHRKEPYYLLDLAFVPSWHWVNLLCLSKLSKLNL